MTTYETCGKDREHGNRRNDFNPWYSNQLKAVKSKRITVEGSRISNRVAEPEVTYTTDDGLETPEVGAWAERKYKLVHMYDELFATGMKNKWTRIYIDLFAGAGKARVRNTNRILLGSPLLAINIPDRYDKYIFCEKDSRLLDSLKRRVAHSYPEVQPEFVGGDCNNKVGEIIGHIPVPSPTNKVLTFCFVDPFSLDIEFQTIKRLASRFIDFLILLAFSDANRNAGTYIRTNSERLDRLLGKTAWRQEWNVEMKKDPSFVRFIAKQYVGQMISLGYNKDSMKLMIENRSDEKNLSLYHLAFFSRHERGYEFWREVRKYALKQPDLFEE